MTLEELIELHEEHRSLSGKLERIRTMNTDALEVIFTPYTGAHIALYPSVWVTKAIHSNAMALVTTRLADLDKKIKEAEACLSSVNSVES